MEETNESTLVSLTEQIWSLPCPVDATWYWAPCNTSKKTIVKILQYVFKFEYCAQSGKKNKIANSYLKCRFHLALLTHFIVGNEEF